MYLELWIDNTRREEIIRKLREICIELWEVSGNYDLIVRVEDEEKVKIDGVLAIRRHYKC